MVVPTDLKKKNILVTGGNGFIGSHLVEKLLDRGAHVVVVYRTLNKKSYFVTKGLHKIVQLEKIDITDRKKCLALSQRYQPDYIVHLAAQTIVTEAFENPYETFNANVMGTVNILEFARTIKRLKGVVVASSDKAYGKTTKKYTEDFPLKGDHPYDVSKSATDLITSTYYKTYNLPTVITRFGNVYGAGDVHIDRIVPGICEAIIKINTLIIRSDGTYIRDYVHVDDVAAGYILLLEKISETIGNAYNFSSKETYSVIELIESVRKLNYENIPYEIKNTVKNEIPYQHLNDAKIRKLGWSNKNNIKKSFSEILLWYQDYFNS